MSSACLVAGGFILGLVVMALIALCAVIKVFWDVFNR